MSSEDNSEFQSLKQTELGSEARTAVFMVSHATLSACFIMMSLGDPETSLASFPPMTHGTHRSPFK